MVVFIVVEMVCPFTKGWNVEQITHTKQPSCQIFCIAKAFWCSVTLLNGQTTDKIMLIKNWQGLYNKLFVFLVLDLVLFASALSIPDN